MPIASLDSKDMVLLIIYLREREKQDFDTFSIDNSAKISKNMAFLEYDLNFDETDNTNSNNKDWKDFFFENT